MNRKRTSRSTGDLRKIYRYSNDISRSRDRMLVLLWTAQNRGTSLDRVRTSRIENLRQRTTRLTLLRHDELMRVYSSVALRRNLSPIPQERRSRSQKPRVMTAINVPVIRIRVVTPEPIVFPPPRTRSPTPELKIKHIVIKPETTTIDMVPTSTQPTSADNNDGDDEQEEEDDDEDEEENIIFPDGITDIRPYTTIARYRRAINQSTDFSQNPLKLAIDSPETLILGLEDFAKQHGCELSFDNHDQRFDKSVFRAACGTVDLGSIHLLASDSMLTAHFQFEIDLDYDREITQSKENVEQFVDDFCQAISEDLDCDKTVIRVFSIDKLAKKSGKSHVNFGLTAVDQKRTERFARTLQDHASTGFSTKTILKHVKPGKYECTWKPALKRLKIRPSDLDPRYNNDYRLPSMPAKLKRGSRPYYLPLSWYRFGLNVQNKYKDDELWLGCNNVEGEWPVAFHGTHADAVSGIVQQGLLANAVQTDAMLKEAIEQQGEKVNRPGLYVATHCNGGSDIYTEPFVVKSVSGQNEVFRIVFQCRVQPGKFTTHKSPVSVGEAWRIVDPTAIRPYGILLKKDEPVEET